MLARAQHLDLAVSTIEAANTGLCSLARGVTYRWGLSKFSLGFNQKWSCLSSTLSKKWCCGRCLVFALAVCCCRRGNSLWLLAPPSAKLPLKYVGKTISPRAVLTKAWYVISTSTSATLPNTMTTTLWKKRSSPTAFTNDSQCSIHVHFKREDAGSALAGLTASGMFPILGCSISALFSWVLCLMLEKNVPFISEKTLGVFSSWNGSATLMASLRVVSPQQQY